MLRVNGRCCRERYRKINQKQRKRDERSVILMLEIETSLKQKGPHNIITMFG